MNISEKCNYCKNKLIINYEEINANFPYDGTPAILKYICPICKQVNNLSKRNRIKYCGEYINRNF